MTTHDIPKASHAFAWFQNLQLLTNPLETLETQAQKYGDIFIYSFARGIPQVRISHPEGIKAVFSANPSQLDSGQEAGIKLGLLGQQSLLALGGKHHQRQRKLLMPPFHGERMQVYGKLICELTEQVVSQWTINKPFSARSSMQAISFEVILRAVFGIADGRCQQLKEVLMAVQNPKRPILIGLMIIFPILKQDLGSWSPWGKFLRLKQKMDDLIFAEIQERRSKLDSTSTDILSLMMAARDEDGEPMTDVELRDELMTLLVTGHETTANSLAWAFYWIHHLPKVRAKLLKELDGLGKKPDPNDIVQLPYLNAVCLETLRIYPIANFTLPRVVKSPIQIMGYPLESGTIVSCCIYLVHHREDLYPEPKQFKPERFLERQFSPYEYLPFGGGNRRCLGYAFALFEMKLVLATVLSRWELELANSKPVKPVRQGILMGPKDGVPIIFKGERKR